MYRFTFSLAARPLHCCTVWRFSSYMYQIYCLHSTCIYMCMYMTCMSLHPQLGHFAGHHPVS